MAGLSIRTAESIAKLTKTSGTALSLAASRINVGALQYVTGALTLNTGTSGLGGMVDALAASTLYYVYAVVSSGSVYLVASTNSSLPTGYTQARMVGYFLTDAVSALWGVGNTGTAIGAYTKRTREIDLVIGAVTSTPSTPNWNTTRARGIFYQDSALVWKLNFNIYGSMTSQSYTEVDIPITGILSATQQAFSSYWNGSGTSRGSAIGGSSNTLSAVQSASAASNLCLSGDIELSSEPTAYTIAANMENINFT